MNDGFFVGNRHGEIAPERGANTGARLDLSHNNLNFMAWRHLSERVETALLGLIADERA